MAAHHDVPKKHGNFDRVVGPLDMGYAPIRLAKWQSRVTGLTVVWVDVDGPLVNGYFTVATEIFDDSGCPHTLEHLIFLGSEKYPYKGILDSLANRAFARGTNAWTDTTHTAYTITTAGEDGFLRLLPVYIDHVLYPTITSAGFVTEVYHVNGKGEDAGVVYSEMQGRENGSGDLMALRTQRCLFGEGSGYRSETGGLMEALRVLTVDQIRDYHKTYYQPHNLTLLVTGKVSPTSLLSVLQDQVEPSLVQHSQTHGPQGPRGWKRPFLETGSRGGGVVKKGKKDEVVEFPEKDESSGEVQISWIGPQSTDFVGDMALDLLTTYLSDSPVSPLAREFIEIDEPFCTDITFYSNDGETTVMSAYLSSVPTEHLSSVGPKLLSAIKRVAEDDGVDMSRMGMVVERARLRSLNQMETDASDALASGLVSDFLYGDKAGEDLKTGIEKEMERYDQLNAWTGDRWASELKRWLVDNPSLTVVGKPSAALADKLDSDTKARLESTKQKYGDEGLDRLGKELEAAQKENDVEVPGEVLERFKVPSVESIRWIGVESARAGRSAGASATELQKRLDREQVDVPVFVQFDQVDSNFITVLATLSPSNLPPGLASLLPLYLSSFFSLPITTASGEELTYEEVVERLDKESVEYEARFGPVVGQTLEISVKVEKSRFGGTIRWIRDLLWGSVFDPDRLRITTAKIIQSLPALKRDGSTVVGALYGDLLYDHDRAPSFGMNLFRQEQAMAEVLKELKEDPKAVVGKMEALRKHLTDPAGIRIGVYGNANAIDRPKATFVEQFEKLKPVKTQPPLLSDAVLGEQGKKPSGKAVVCSMSAIESSFGYLVAAGPQGFDHPDRPALDVAASVLNAMESYLWKYIRGAGLAYGASIRHSAETGHVSLRIYRSPDCAKAFAEAGRVVKELVSGKIKLDHLTVESAKSSMAFSTANSESTVGEAAYQSFNNQALKGLPQQHQRELLMKAQSVTLEQVLGAIERYLFPIFDPKTSFAVVASSVTKAGPIVEALEKEGFKVERRELASGGDDDEEDEDEEEGEDEGSEEGSGSSSSDVVGR